MTSLPSFALASTLVMVLYTVALAIAWHARVGRDGVPGILSSLVRSMVGAAVAAPIAWLVVNWISGSELPGFWGSLGLVAVGTTVVVSVYAAMARVLGSPEFAELRGRIKQ